MSPLWAAARRALEATGATPGVLQALYILVLAEMLQAGLSHDRIIAVRRTLFHHVDTALRRRAHLFAMIRAGCKRHLSRYRRGKLRAEALECAWQR